MKCAKLYSSERGASTFAYSFLLAIIIASVFWALSASGPVTGLLQENMTVASDGIAGGSTVGTTASGEIPSATLECQPDPFGGNPGVPCSQQLYLAEE